MGTGESGSGVCAYIITLASIRNGDDGGEEERSQDGKEESHLFRLFLNKRTSAK